MQRMILRTLWLFGGLMTMALAQAGSNAGTAAIAGRVTRNGEPVANVSVFAKRAIQLGGWEQPGVSVKTDSNGQYMFLGLNAGSYSLSVKSVEDLIVDGNIARNAINSGKSVVLRANESISGINFLLIKGGVITGTITDENDKPVVRTDVTLLQDFVRHPNGRRVEFSHTYWYSNNSTDNQGRYRLTGLPPGKYIVRVGLDASEAANQGKFYPFTFAPGTTDEAKAKIIEVIAGGEVTGINIKLNPPEPVYLAKGRIVDATTGQPLAGVRILHATVFSSGDPIRLLNGTHERTNAQGEFQLLGLRPGKHVACLRAEDAPDYYAEWTHFEVADSDVKGLEIKASRGSTISGVVSIEGAKSATLPPDRSDLVVVYRYDSDELHAPKGKLPRVNSDGSFVLTGLKPGTVRLFVNNANFAAPRIFLFRTERNGQVLLDGKVPIQPSEQVTNVRLVIGSGTGSVRGHVTFTGGSLPIGDSLIVYIFKMKGNEIEDRRPAVVDGKGRFFVEGVLPGDYRLNINAPGTMQLAPNVRQRLTSSHTFTVTANAETPIVLTYDLSEEGK